MRRHTARWDDVPPAVVEQIICEHFEWLGDQLRALDRWQQESFENSITRGKEDRLRKGSDRLISVLAGISY